MEQDDIKEELYGRYHRKSSAADKKHFLTLDDASKGLKIFTLLERCSNSCKNDEDFVDTMKFCHQYELVYGENEKSGDLKSSIRLRYLKFVFKFVIMCNDKLEVSKVDCQTDGSFMSLCLRLVEPCSGSGLSGPYLAPVKILSTAIELLSAPDSVSDQLVSARRILAQCRHYLIDAMVEEWKTLTAFKGILSQMRTAVKFDDAVFEDDVAFMDRLMDLANMKYLEGAFIISENLYKWVVEYSFHVPQLKQFKADCEKKHQRAVDAELCKESPSQSQRKGKGKGKGGKDAPVETLVVASSPQNLTSQRKGKKKKGGKDTPVEAPATIQNLAETGPRHPQNLADIGPRDPLNLAATEPLGPTSISQTTLSIVDGADASKLQFYEDYKDVLQNAESSSSAGRKEAKVLQYFIRSKFRGPGSSIELNDFLTDSDFLFQFCRYIMNGEKSVSKLPSLRVALDIASFADDASIDYAKHVMVACRSNYYLSIINEMKLTVDRSFPLDDDLSFMKALMDLALANSRNSLKILKYCTEFAKFAMESVDLKKLRSKAQTEYATEYAILDIEEGYKAASPPLIEIGSLSDSCEVYLKNQKIEIQPRQVEYMLTEVEVSGSLYHGTLSEGDEEVSFISVADTPAASKLYAGSSKEKKINAMVDYKFRAGKCPVVNKELSCIEKGIVCIEKVCSFNQWLMKKIVEFEINCEDSAISRESLQFWFLFILSDFKIIFRQLIGGILDFWEKGIIPEDLRHSILLTPSLEVKLIPSVDKYPDAQDAHDLQDEEYPQNKQFDSIVKQLRAVVSKALFPHLPLELSDENRSRNYALLPLELRFFCDTLIQPKLWIKTDKRFTLCSPYFWSLKERADFLWILNDLKKGFIVPEDLWTQNFQNFCKNGSILRAWQYIVPRKGPLWRVYANNFYKDPGDSIRFIANVFRHYIDNAGGELGDSYVNKDHVMKEIMKTYPLVSASFYKALHDLILTASESEMKACNTSMVELKYAIKCWNCDQPHG